MAARIPGLTKPPFKSFKPSGKEKAGTVRIAETVRLRIHFGSKNLRSFRVNTTLGEHRQLIREYPHASIKIPRFFALAQRLKQIAVMVTIMF